MRTWVVLRLSSMGDVLLTLPVILGVLKENPGVRVHYVTSAKFVPYFEGIERLEVIPFDAGTNHRGLFGLFRLHRQIVKAGPFDGVIDLHSVLRTWILDVLFLFSLKRVVLIRKFRSRTRAIIKGREAPRMPHTVVRYVKAFQRAGVKAAVSSRPLSHITGLAQKVSQPVRTFRVGIAPLARHRTKMWGEEPVARLLTLLGEMEDVEVHLFGGVSERPLLLRMARQGQRVEAGLHTLEEEANLIAGLDVFISMDSANMHLASLAGVPTLSIWGGTHPDMGFSPLGQPRANLIQASREEVGCRPCSVYGENPCHLKEDPMRCMRLITPEMVLKEILRFKSI